MPNDENLSCEQLESGIEESQYYKKKALYSKTNTGGNYARMILFWPALATTFHNADVAVKAADERSYHLIKIMRDKKCKKADKLYNQVMNTTPLSLSQELRALNDMYESGILNKEEYEKAKSIALSK